MSACSGDAGSATSAPSSTIQRPLTTVHPVRSLPLKREEDPSGAAGGGLSAGGGGAAAAARAPSRSLTRAGKPHLLTRLRACWTSLPARLELARRARSFSEA